MCCLDESSSVPTAYSRALLRIWSTHVALLQGMALEKAKRWTQHLFHLVTVRPNSLNPSLQPCCAANARAPGENKSSPRDPQPWIRQRERGQEHVGVGMCGQEHVYTGASMPISAGIVPCLPVYQPISVHSPHVNLPHTCLKHEFRRVGQPRGLMVNLPMVNGGKHGRRD